MSDDVDGSQSREQRPQEEEKVVEEEVHVQHPQQKRQRRQQGEREIHTLFDVVEDIRSEQEARQRIMKAIEVCFAYSQVDGDHHKAWVLDEIMRALAGEHYGRVVELHNVGEDGPDSYTWNCGFPP